jgi:hypothetical protein
MGPNPLVNGGGKLIPSVARAFRGDRDLEVFLQAYMGNALAGQGSSQLAEKVAANSSVIGFVSLYCHSTRFARPLALCLIYSKLIDVALLSRRRVCYSISTVSDTSPPATGFTPLTSSDSLGTILIEQVKHFLIARPKQKRSLAGAFSSVRLMNSLTGSSRAALFLRLAANPPYLPLTATTAARLQTSAYRTHAGWNRSCCPW